MDYLAAELRDIADAVEKFAAFAESQFNYESIMIEWPEFVLEFVVTNKSGDALGKIGYTDDGFIGFKPEVD